MPNSNKPDHQTHKHRCGHGCACGEPQHVTCVSCEMATAVKVDYDRQRAIWERRWPGREWGAMGANRG